MSFGNRRVRRSAVLAVALAAAAASILYGRGSAAQTVVSTEHYQQLITLTCGAKACNGDLRKAGANRRLNITRVSCFLIADAGSTYSHGVISLFKPDLSAVLSQVALPVAFSAANGTHSVNQAVDVQATGGQDTRLSLLLDTGQVTGGAACTATGTLDTLG